MLYPRTLKGKAQVDVLLFPVLRFNSDDPRSETVCSENPNKTMIACLRICYIIIYNMHMCICIYDNYT